jgi:16S rRNA (uracil1498-N3)-methyltransferase
VVAVEPARVVVRVHEPLPWPRQEPQLTVVAGALKHRAMQLLVAKAAELGVDRLVLCGMRRCVARLAEDRQEHLVAVAREAARQVGRQTVPEVALCPSLDVALARLQGVQLYFLWERGGASFRDLRLDPEAGCVCVVGPEGGFAEEEVELLLSRGALPLSLDGPALKAETAALAGMVLFLFLAGRFC